MAITCFFAASYVNADISRYYLGPALMAWTWLAILAGGRRRARDDGRRGATRADTEPADGAASRRRRRPRPPSADRTRGRR